MMKMKIETKIEGNRIAFRSGSLVCYIEQGTDRLTASAFLNHGETCSRSFGRNTCSKTFKTFAGARKAVVKWIQAHA